MCYCYRKLEIWEFCEAVWEAVVSDWIRQICQTDLSNHRARPPKIPRESVKMIKFGLSWTRPLNICHVICLSQSGHAPSHTASHRLDSHGLPQTLPGERVCTRPPTVRESEVLIRLYRARESDQPEDRTPLPARVRSAPRTPMASHHKVM